MRRTRPAVNTLALCALALCGAPGLAFAQATPPAPPASPPPAAPSSPPSAPQAAPPSAPQAAPTAPPDPQTVIATVGGQQIRYADLEAAMQGLPEQLRALPPQMIYPMLLDRLIDQTAIVQLAKKQKLQDDPTVQQAIQRATDQALSNALLTREITPMLTPEAVQARYDAEYAHKPGEEEVRAAHILVASEDKAKEIIAQLEKGADFTQLAKDNSTDPSAKENNGELGWFKKGDMLPEFSQAAFALEPGQYTKTPIKTRFGWHVIKVEEKRTAPPPKLDEVRNEIRQQIIQEGVQKVLAQAKEGLKIEKFNPDGSPAPAAPASPPTGK